MADQATPTGTPDIIEAHYIKSNFFRVVHADGVYGGGSPRGLLTMAFYSERQALPKKSSFPLINNIPGPETVVETKAGIVREVEVDVFMDLPTAASLYGWLGGRLEELRHGLGISDEQFAKMTGGKK